jgi:hypothetical protein
MQRSGEAGEITPHVGRAAGQCHRSFPRTVAPWPVSLRGLIAISMIDLAAKN